MKQAISYLRVSTDKKPVSNHTIAVQIHRVREEAKSLKLTLIPDNKKTYKTTITRVTSNDRKGGSL